MTKTLAEIEQSLSTLDDRMEQVLQQSLSGTPYWPLYQQLGHLSDDLDDYIDDYADDYADDYDDSQPDPVWVSISIGELLRYVMHRVGCGEQWDELLADYDALQKEHEWLQSELETA